MWFTLSLLIMYFRYASENVNKLLVGNKNDLTSQRAVSFEQGKVFQTPIRISVVHAWYAAI